MIKFNLSAPEWAHEFALELQNHLINWERRPQLPRKIPRFAVGDLPDPGIWSGHIIYITDETGGPVPAFSDGTNWRRVTDRNIVS